MGVLHEPLHASFPLEKFWSLQRLVLSLHFGLSLWGKTSWLSCIQSYHSPLVNGPMTCFLVAYLLLSCGGKRGWIQHKPWSFYLRKLLKKPGSLSLWLRLCRSLIMLYFHGESCAFSRSKRLLSGALFFYKSFSYEDF